jgi:4-hydroxy-3-methylbut-2-enyl diphosphate reductase
MLDDAADLDPAWVADKQVVGVTAGASAPDNLVEEVTERLRALGAAQVSELDGSVERVTFPLPKLLTPRDRGKVG